VPVFGLTSRPVFPDPRKAEPDGLLAVGGNLSPARLLNAYRAGIFPWYDEDSPILWWSPPERAILLPGDERFSRRTQRALRQLDFQVKVDSCFEAVIGHCARTHRPGQGGTWITPEMERAYRALHHQGYAHSFETFRDGRLVGGLYGLSLGAAFFGESMFSLENYASRAAFAELCRTAWGWGFQFIDGQLPNANLADLGARVVGREDFLGRLARALEQPTRRGRWNADAPPES
jgi:leucyl/phenylalanyl-tRNA--protein transferase